MISIKIKRVTWNSIVFSNGSKITYSHEQICCEYNYADFQQIDDIARATDFDEPLTFKCVPNHGFRFGNPPQKMFFVPCYTEQNGYYSSDIRILYNGETVLDTMCEWRDS